MPMSDQDTEAENSGAGRWVAGIGGAAAGGGAAYALNHRSKDAIHKTAAGFSTTLAEETEKINGSFDNVKSALAELTDSPEAHEAAEKLFKHHEELNRKEATSLLAPTMREFQEQQSASNPKAFGALNPKDPFDLSLRDTLDGLIEQGKPYASSEVKQAIHDALHAKIEPYFTAQQNAHRLAEALEKAETKAGGNQYTLKESLFDSEEWRTIQKKLLDHFNDDREKLGTAQDGITGALEDAYKSGGDLSERALELSSSGRYEGIAEDIQALYQKGHDIDLANVMRANHLSDAARKKAEHLASYITNDETLHAFLETHAQNPKTTYASIREEVGQHLPRICKERIGHVKDYVEKGDIARLLQHKIETAAQEAAQLKAATPAVEEDCLGKIANAIQRSKLKVPGGEGAVVAAGALAAGAAAVGIHALLSGRNKSASYSEKIEAERQQTSPPTHSPS